MHLDWPPLHRLIKNDQPRVNRKGDQKNLLVVYSSERGGKAATLARSCARVAPPSRSSAKPCCPRETTKTQHEGELLVCKIRRRKSPKNIHRQNGRQKSTFRPAESDQFQIGTRMGCSNAIRPPDGNCGIARIECRYRRCARRPDLTKLPEKDERSSQFLHGNSEFPFDSLSR